MARAIDADELQELCNRRIQDTWNSGTAPVSWAAAYADFKDDIDSMPTLTPPNEPLTLEELRKMDGEPVYLIVDDQYEPLKMWALIEVVETANCVILTNNLGGRNEYYDNDEMKDDGVTAYRRPPEGEA